MPLVAPLPLVYRDGEAARQITLIAESFARLLGRPLVDDGHDVVASLWEAPRAIVAHGTETDPIFFFGNAYALGAFECDAESFTRMPSRLSAETPLRARRQALLDRVAAQGFIEDYQGVRITARGRRFRIDRAIVWNIVDAGRGRVGQAATVTL